MTKTVYFDGHNLTANFYVYDLVRPNIDHEITTHDVPGHNGLVYAGTKMQARAITMSLAYISDNEETRRAALHELESWLNVDTPKVLQFSDDGDLYFLAIPQNCGKTKEWLNASGVSLEFIIPDPVMYEGSVRRNPTIDANNKYVFTGSYPTGPYIAGTGCVPGQSGYWGVRLDGGDYMRVSLDSGTHSVVIDCAARTVLVDSVASMLTLDSDWFEIAPGAHTIANDVGSSASLTISYFPRWL